MGVCLALICAFSEVQAQVLQGIPRLGSELVNSPEISIRRKAAQGLGRAATNASVRLLMGAMAGEKDQGVRLEILRALRTIAFQRYPGFRLALQGLGQAANRATERNDLIRLRAIEALWEAGKKDLLDPVPILERQLTDPSERLQLAAVLMLGKHGSVEAADALGQALLNPALSETVRLAAVHALGAVALTAGGPVGRDVATANIATTTAIGIPALVTQRATDTRHERQIRYLTLLVNKSSTSETLTLKAVKSLGRIKDRSSIPALQQLLGTHPSLTVRKQATLVLSHVLARQYE
ncbi:MAG: HEAT repeat domain-containing protein [Candidatus Latescibacterota bacterium]|nr:HEAT repeat domain-containing protein [Candidatus Latescibacterota bacterium]